MNTYQKNSYQPLFKTVIAGAMLVVGSLSADANVDPSHALTFPAFVGAPDTERAVTNRALTMVSSMAVSPLN